MHSSLVSRASKGGGGGGGDGRGGWGRGQKRDEVQGERNALMVREERGRDSGAELSMYVQVCGGGL